MVSRPFVAFAVAFAAAGVARAQSNGGSATAPEVRALLVAGHESAALEELRQAEIAMFGTATPLVDRPSPGPTFGPPSALTSRGASPAAARAPLEGDDVQWLEGVALPDLPMRWEPRVISYLEYFRRDARGRLLMEGWLRRSGRYGAMIRDALRARDLPEDLRCVAMAESGFDPTVESDRGAAGMWQFVVRTGTEYGLTKDHWVDERRDPVRSTEAAAALLGDLQRRFGSWELALAAYNMGYGALLRAIRKYNSNDFWLLASLEAGLPFETTVYVSKVLACAIVMRNPERFGFADLARDPPIEVTTVELPGGTPLGMIARAAGITPEELTALNPQLKRSRIPPGVERYGIRIPRVRAEAFASAWTRRHPTEPQHAVHVARFGERLADVARRYRTTIDDLRTLNELEPTQEVLAGLALLVPAVRPVEDASREDPPLVAVPPAPTSVPDRRRVFYRIASGDRIEDVARFFEVGVDDLRRWNHVDPDAALHTGMFLQLFVPEQLDLSRAMVFAPNDVRLVVVGSEEFFRLHEDQRGRVRIRYVVREGDTVASIAERFGLGVGDLARINRFGRRTELRPGAEVIVYTDPALLRPSERASAARASAEAREPAEEPAEASGGGSADPASAIER